MNIDLLFTEEGEAGLISSKNYVKKVVGIVFDTEQMMLTIEFSDMDYMETNIPLDEEFQAYLDMNQTLHVGSVVNGNIAQAYQVPLMFSDDPYRHEQMKSPALKQGSPLVAFDYFVQACIAGQPVNRDDLGDEDNMGCILGDSSPSSLAFAPHLARRHAMEAQPKAAPSLNAPGMGLGGGGGGGRIIRGSSAGGGAQSGNSSGQRGSGKKGKFDEE